jgi:hypothetical protein
MLIKIVVMKKKKKILVFDEKQKVLLFCSYDMIWTIQKHHSNIGIRLYIGIHLFILTY